MMLGKLLYYINDNLGKYIFDKFSEQNKVFGISRSKINKKNYFSADLNFSIQVKKVFNKIKKKVKKIDTIIFLLQLGFILTMKILLSQTLIY